MNISRHDASRPARRLLVTGACGFLARAVGEAFAADGWEVLGLARPGSGPQAAAGDAPYPVLAAEHTAEELRRRLAEFSPLVVFHGAGAASVGRSMQSPGSDFNDSALLFHRLLEAVRTSGVSPRVVYPSSAAVYGNAPRILAEDARPAPISPYGFHKWQCEVLGEQYATLHGIPVTVLRVFSVFGPRQRKLLIWEIFRQARAEGRIRLRGTGLETRDYLPDDVLAEMVRRVVMAGGAMEGDRPFTLMNLATGRGTCIGDIARKISAHLGGLPVEAAGTPIPGDPQSLVADTARLTALLGEAPGFSMDAALRRCLTAWSAAEPQAVPQTLPEAMSA